MKCDTIRVLLVDDDEEDAVLLRRLLSGSQDVLLQVQRVTTLAAAIRAVDQEPFDLVLLDLCLPDSRGLDTLVRMRAAAARLPIVVLSGGQDDDLEIQAIRNGAQDYVVKGLPDRAAFVRAIRFAVERHRVQLALVARVAELEQEARLLRKKSSSHL